MEAAGFAVSGGRFSRLFVQGIQRTEYTMNDIGDLRAWHLIVAQVSSDYIYRHPQKIVP